MDVGSKIGQKMRLAIKVKLREMGCYVDDELPDYVMVMVANKRTRIQMEEDLLLFLGDNTDTFVNWLHQVLKKLQEVTITAPIAESEPQEKLKPETSKEKEKIKEKKDKHKKHDSKKSKKKDKDKGHKRKSDKKSHKRKKRSKDNTIKRPNIPPLLMNMEKNAEPSITDVFAGQILKNHGIVLENLKEDEEEKNNDTKKKILPIIEPITVSSNNESSQDTSADSEQASTSRENQLQEITDIEQKIQGLKQKLAEQLEEGGSDDEDFVNIRTENEELIADFADDVLQEITSTQTITTPRGEETQITKSPEVTEAPEVLPQIELQLPKRPVRSRLGDQAESSTVLDTPEESTLGEADSCERFTPEKQIVEKPQRSLRERLGSPVERRKRRKSNDKPEESSNKYKSSHSKVLESRSSRVAPASIVRVRPRPRPASTAPASNLLFRAVADAQKSMNNMSNAIQPQSKLKQALVLPMPRGLDAQKIVIQVSGDSVPLTSPPDGSDCEIDIDTESLADLENMDVENKPNINETEYVPAPLTRKVKNTPKYVPTRRDDEKSSNESLDLNNITIHTRSKDNNPQFVVTLEGLDPNIFLAKKLKTEGLLDEAEEMAILKTKPKKPIHKSVISETDPESGLTIETAKISEGKKRLSDTSDDSGTQVIIKQEKDSDIIENKTTKVTLLGGVTEGRKRKASPIVFDVAKKKEKVIERERERTVSAGSDNHVIITSNPSHKYDAIPPLSQQEKKQVQCRSFPACRFGDSCAFLHPPCKFSATCTRPHCPYKHPEKQPPIASHVVPSANYKSISSATPLAVCKYYPHCSNPGCHYFHPKPCRYGKSCSNKNECNFYHHEVANSALKWRSSKV